MGLLKENGKENGIGYRVLVSRLQRSGVWGSGLAGLLSEGMLQFYVFLKLPNRILHFRIPSLNCGFRIPSLNCGAQVYLSSSALNALKSRPKSLNS